MAHHRYAAFAAVSLALLSVGSAAAAGLEQEFANICMPAYTEAEATANARAAGYVAAPDEIKRRVKGFPGDGTILWRSLEGENTIFLAANQFQGSSPIFREPMMVQLCVVLRSPVDAGLDAKLQALLGVGAKQTVGQGKTYIYEQTAAGRVRINPRQGHLTDMAWDKRLRMAAVVKQTDASSIVQMAPRQLTEDEQAQLVRAIKPR